MKALVLRGVVEVGPVDGENLSRSGRAAALAHTRRFYPGQIVTLPVAEAARLVKLGVLPCGAVTKESTRSASRSARAATSRLAASRRISC
jgi:hypothetical protein